MIYSGGGFSNVFPLPTYQSLAVHTYFSKHKPSYSASQYNNTQRTRGFPDISANGANYAVPIGGKYYRVFGTSASSPVVGAIVTLLNGERLSVGKGPVGFINPVLVSWPPLFILDFTWKRRRLTGVVFPCSTPTPGLSTTSSPAGTKAAVPLDLALFLVGILLLAWYVLPSLQPLTSPSVSLANASIFCD